MPIKATCCVLWLTMQCGALRVDGTSNTTSSTESFSTCSTIDTPNGPTLNATVGNKLGQWLLQFQQTTPVADGVVLNITTAVGARMLRNVVRCGAGTNRYTRMQCGVDNQESGALDDSKTPYVGMANSAISYATLSVSSIYDSVTVTVNTNAPTISWVSTLSLSLSLSLNLPLTHSPCVRHWLCG
jgi:hypothetical protein